MNQSSRCGYIAIIGRPNVGKSTLLNKILATKISITSKKPQTTRHRILGIKTAAENQAIFVDTPGMHLNPLHKINEMMVKAAISAIHDVDIILLMIDARGWQKEDDYILSKLKKITLPIIVAINKIDYVKDKKKLLPLLAYVQEKLVTQGINHAEIIPISAKTGAYVAEIEQIVYQKLPHNPHFFPDDQITDRSERFIAQELIREKLLRLLGEEVPHKTAVEIEQFKEEDKLIRISAVIWVERIGQKKIIIGGKGEKLKAIGQKARLEMEKMLAKKVFLQLWVKVKQGWSDDKRALIHFGYGEK